MRTDEDRHLAKGVFAGMVGGLVASWVMNQFQAALQKAEEAWRKSAHRAEGQAKNSTDGEAEDATMKAADRVAYIALNRHLTQEEKKKAGPLVHYAYGAIIGGMYGCVAELLPASTAGKGSVYGAAAWLIGDEIAVPKLGFSKPSREYPVKVHAEALAAHLVYGVTTDTVRRGLKALS
jgi:putative membrane protein